MDAIDLDADARRNCTPARSRRDFDPTNPYAFAVAIAKDRGPRRQFRKSGRHGPRQRTRDAGSEEDDLVVHGDIGSPSSRRSSLPMRSGITAGGRNLVPDGH
ncbi:hypothetical protein AB5I41_09775 [Sphingomonas sp. MMS24-JH45]